MHMALSLHKYPVPIFLHPFTSCYVSQYLSLKTIMYMTLSFHKLSALLIQCLTLHGEIHVLHHLTSNVGGHTLVVCRVPWVSREYF